MRCSLPFIQLLRGSGASKGVVDNERVEAPGDNRKVYGFGLVDWCDGWFDGRIAPGRTSDVFCEQVRAAVARSTVRGRVAIIITRQSQDPYSSGIPARAEHADRTLRSVVSGLHACL